MERDIFKELQDKPSPEDVSGYREYAGYPAQYQAVDFPLYGDRVRMTGNNQAFFFVKAVKDEAGHIDIVENADALKKLFQNVFNADNQKCSFHLQMDADVFENPERFIDKYQSLRSEADEAQRRFLLGKEIAIIRTFVESGKLVTMAREALEKRAQLCEKPCSGDVVENDLAEFFGDNFRIEGVRVKDALQFATWEITKGEQIFLARQEYKNSTYMLDRPWRVGEKDAVNALSERGHEGAKALRDAVDFTRGLETVDLTFGLNASKPAGVLKSVATRPLPQM